MKEVTKEKFREAIMEHGLKHYAFASPLSKLLHSDPDNIEYYEGGGLHGEVHVWEEQDYRKFTVKYFLGPIEEDANETT